jgi:hypothetical protein
MKLPGVVLGSLSLWLLQGCASMPEESVAGIASAASSSQERRCPDSFVKVCTASVASPDMMVCGCSAGFPLDGMYH